jgi:hypothetical protein
VIALVVVAGFAPAAAAAPNLTVTVDGTTVEDGGTVTVTDDPLIGIEASGDGTIVSVELRVDGETRRTFQPDAESFSDTIDLDLDDGDHELTVVAAGSGTTRQTVTVRKDSDGPRVSYTSPFTTERTGPTGTVTIEEADTTIAGELFDRSGVEMVRIERNYEWMFAGQTRRDRTTHRIADPGDNFSRPLLFGLGENEMRVEVIDVHGQRSTHDFTVEVVDGTRPSIDLDRFERSGNTLEVAGVVSDNVKVESLSVRAASGEKSVLTETSREPNRERLTTEFEFSARVTDGTEEITLVATDVAGNTREWDVPLDYRGHIVPTVSIDEGATRVDGDGVAVSGLVADGRVTRVVVETVGPDGTTVSTATIHEGEATDRVPVRARLGSADGDTTVVVRAVDADGRTHEATLTLATGGGSTTEAPSTPAEATTAAPSTPVATTAAAADEATAVADQQGGQSLGASGRLPVSAPLAGGALVLVVAAVGLAVAFKRGVDVGGIEAAAPADDAEPTAGGSTEPGDGPETGTAADRPAGGGRGADPLGGGSASPAAESADTASGESGGTATPAEPTNGTGESDAPSPPEAGSVDPEPEPEPDPTPDVTALLGVASMADVDADDVATLAERLEGGDDAAEAARGLAEIAAERPTLLRDTTAESRLRDLRLDPDPAVSEAASEAVRRLVDADE